jgi:hypothetical protein
MKWASLVLGHDFEFKRHFQAASLNLAGKLIIFGGSLLSAQSLNDLSFA